MSAEQELADLLALRDERFDGSSVEDLARQAIALADETEGDERDIINALVPALQAAFLLGKGVKQGEDEDNAKLEADRLEHARKYPEHNKLLTHAVERTTAQGFYDFLTQDKALHFGTHHNHTEDCESEDDHDKKMGWGATRHCGLSGTYLNSVHIPPEDLMAEFLEIDRNKLEDEKRAMLNELQEANARRGP